MGRTRWLWVMLLAGGCGAAHQSAIVEVPAPESSTVWPASLGGLALDATLADVERWCDAAGGEYWTESAGPTACTGLGLSPGEGTDAFCDGVRDGVFGRNVFAHAFFDASGRAREVTFRLPPNELLSDVMAVRESVRADVPQRMPRVSRRWFGSRCDGARCVDLWRTVEAAVSLTTERRRRYYELKLAWLPNRLSCQPAIPTRSRIGSRVSLTAPADIVATASRS